MPTVTWARLSEYTTIRAEALNTIFDAFETALGGDFVPSVAGDGENGDNLGAADNRWETVYGVAFNLTGALTYQFGENTFAQTPLYDVGGDGKFRVRWAFNGTTSIEFVDEGDGEGIFKALQHSALDGQNCTLTENAGQQQVICYTDANGGRVEIRTSAASQLEIHDGLVRPDSAGGTDLGSSTFPFGDLHLSGGDYRLAALPTSDPSVAGRLWSDGGTIKVSSG